MTLDFQSVCNCVCIIRYIIMIVICDDRDCIIYSLLTIRFELDAHKIM